MKRMSLELVFLAGLFVGCADARGPDQGDAVKPQGPVAGGSLEASTVSKDAADSGERGAALNGAEIAFRASQGGAEPADDGGQAPVGENAEAQAGVAEPVKAGAIRLKASNKWVRKQPRSGFVAAEFQLPRAEGDERDGRLTVSMAGGSVKANLERWRAQFGGKPVKDSEDEVEIAGATVTVVDFSGTYNDSRGPFAPGVQRAGYRMIGAVIPVEGRLHFVKAYGPEKTMEQYAKSIRSFIQTLEIDKP